MYESAVCMCVRVYVYLFTCTCPPFLSLELCTRITLASRSAEICAPPRVIYRSLSRVSSFSPRHVGREKIERRRVAREEILRCKNQRANERTTNDDVSRARSLFFIREREREKWGKEGESKRGRKNERKGTSGTRVMTFVHAY